VLAALSAHHQVNRPSTRYPVLSRVRRKELFGRPKLRCPVHEAFLSDRRATRREERKAERVWCLGWCARDSNPEPTESTHGAPKTSASVVGVAGMSVPADRVAADDGQHRREQMTRWRRRQVLVVVAVLAAVGATAGVAAAYVRRISPPWPAAEGDPVRDLA
jgi:hypothetical protein